MTNPPYIPREAVEKLAKLRETKGLWDSSDPAHARNRFTVLTAQRELELVAPLFYAAWLEQAKKRLLSDEFIEALWEEIRFIEERGELKKALAAALTALGPEDAEEEPGGRS